MAKNYSNDMDETRNSKNKYDNRSQNRSQNSSQNKSQNNYQNGIVRQEGQGMAGCVRL